MTSYAMSRLYPRHKQTSEDRGGLWDFAIVICHPDQNLALSVMNTEPRASLTRAYLVVDMMTVSKGIALVVT